MRDANQRQCLQPLKRTGSELLSKGDNLFQQISIQGFKKEIMSIHASNPEWYFLEAPGRVRRASEMKKYNYHLCLQE